MAERRREAMNYDVWFDESNRIVYLKTYHTLTENDVHELMEVAGKKFEGKEIRYSLIDLSEATSEPIQKGTREAFKKYADSLTYDKVAIVGANPTTRMLAKIALAVVGKSKVAKFFKTEEEALKWLKGEK